MNHAEMELHFSPCTLRGAIRYALDAGTVPFFLLNDRFRITRVTDDTGACIPFQRQPDQGPGCRQSCYTVEMSDAGRYTIEFESIKPFRRYPTQRKRADRYNFFTGERIFLYDNYLRFFPRLEDPDPAVRTGGHRFPCAYESLTAYGLEDYEVSFAERRADGTCVIRTPKQDCFLVYALRKGSFWEARCGQFRALTQKRSEQEQARAVAQANSDVLSWYNQNLYAEKPVHNSFELISLGFSHSRNAYVRDHLTVYENFRIPSDVCESYIPHELGHLWCISGTFSAVGFLDEGGAEWSAEIYRYHHNRESFEKHRKQYEQWSERYWKKLCREQDSGKNPGSPNRHLLGFRFFNRIYQQFDLDTVRRCILCYALPDVQNPAEFLKRAQNMESDAVYRFVQKETQDILSRF